MHASRLVELAAATASFHRPLMERSVPAEFWASEQFWVLSRARVNEWSRLIKQCQRSRNQSTGVFDPKQFWRATAPMLEEIFLSEVCTRVWCATLAIVDEQRLHGELAPIARSVFVANLEVRRRALRLLLFCRGLQDLETRWLNQMRRDCEVWTDGLLSQLSSTRLAQQFGFDKRRIASSAQQMKRRGTRVAARHLNAMLVSMRFSLAARKPQSTVCPELNQELAANLLACLPLHGFDGAGVPSPIWSVHSFQSDLLSIEILEDLCGNSLRPRYDVPGGLMDRR